MIVNVFVGQDEHPSHVVECDSFDVRAGVLYFYHGLDELPFMVCKLWSHARASGMPEVQV